MGKHIALTGSDGWSFDGYSAETKGVPAGGLVCREIFGVNPHIRDVCDRFAESLTSPSHRRCSIVSSKVSNPAIRRTRYLLRCGLCKILILEPSCVIQPLLSVS